MKGKCYYCNKELTERTIKRHMKSCPNMKKVISDEINSSKGTRNQFIISMKDKYDKNTYCIYLLIDENLQLQHLDQFIRHVWVECCGHLSAFYIDGIRYEDNSNDLYQMNVKLKDALFVGDKFEYEYDFGTTTYIILEVVDKVEVSKNHSQIEIIARNDENHYKCSHCGKQVEYYSYGTGDYICGDCADDFDEDELEELCGDYFNSPRDGVCGYVGDKDAELPYMPGNNNTYKISRKKPQLEDDEFKFWNHGGYDYGQGNNNLLDRLLAYTESCNDNITEDEIIEILNEEFSQMMINNLKEINNELMGGIENIFKKCVFSFDLEELLNGYTKMQIKQIAENLNIKIPSNSNKNTYIQNLSSMYQDFIKNEIYKMDQDKYNILEKCINNKGILNNVEENLEKYIFFKDKGILFPTINNGENVFIMPTVVQNIINDINVFEVRNILKTNTEIINLFRGMIKVYGVLSYDDTIMLLKKYIDNIDEAKVIQILKENDEYYFEEYDALEKANIFNEDKEIKMFVNFDIDDYEDILLEINNNMEYSYISKEELISMAYSDYWAKSKLGKTFIKGIREIFPIPKDDIIDVMNMLVLDVQTINIDEIINDIIEEIGVKLDKDIRFYIEQVVGNLLKNVPMWKFKGATISQIEVGKKEENLSNKKIGRNETCPCGSGKKYKNCCGKVISLF